MQLSRRLQRSRREMSESKEGTVSPRAHGSCVPVRLRQRNEHAAGIVDCELWTGGGRADRRQGITAARNGTAVAAVGKKREKSGTSSGRNA